MADRHQIIVPVRIDLKRQGPKQTEDLRDPFAPVMQSISRKLQRFDYDYPNFQLVRLTRNYGNNRWDCKTLLGGELRWIKSIDRNSYKLWKVGMMAVLGHNNRDKGDPYLKAVVGMAPAVPSLVKPAYWPTIAQSINRTFSVGDQGPENLNVLWTYPLGSSLNNTLSVIRVDSQGYLWVMIIGTNPSAGIYRLEKNLEAEGAERWEIIPELFIGDFGTVESGPLTGYTWYPNDFAGPFTLLPSTNDLWIPVGALQIFVAFEGGVQLWGQDGVHKWTKAWYSLASDDPQYLGNLISDPIDNGSDVFVLSTIGPAEDSGGETRLYLSQIDKADGNVISRVELEYNGDDEHLKHRSSLTVDSYDGAVNPYLGVLAGSGAFYPNESNQWYFYPHSQSANYFTPGNFNVGGYCSLRAVIDGTEKLLVIPRVTASQLRVFDALAGGALWGVVEGDPEQGPTEDGEMILRMPVAAIPAVTEGLHAPKPPRLIVAWEKVRYKYLPAFSKINGFQSNQVAVWLGLYAMQAGGAYNAANEWAWTDQANWDIVMDSEWFSKLRFEAPFSQLPGVTPGFFFPSDVDLVPNPWSTMAAFLESGEEAPEPPEEIMDITGVFDQPIAASVYEYIPGPDEGSPGVGAKIVASEPGWSLGFTPPGTGGWYATGGEIIALTAQAFAMHNGLYEVTNAGTIEEPWELTRIADADEGSELFNLWIRETWFGFNNLWFCSTPGIMVGEDPLYFHPATEGEGLVPIIEGLYPGPEVEACQLITGFRVGMETRDLSQPNLPVIGEIDFADEVLATKIRREWTGEDSVKLKVGTPTLTVKITSKGAGAVVPYEEIRHSPPGGNPGKLLADQTIVAIVKHRIRAVDMTNGVEGTEIYQENPDTGELKLIGYGEYEEWDQEAYAWVFWYVERNFTESKGLVPDAHQAEYYCYCWEYDAVTVEVFDSAPPAWDMKMCTVSVNQNLAIFPPHSTFIGVWPGPLRDTTGGFGPELYGPLPGPENFYPRPLPCDMPAFDIDTWELKWRAEVGPVVGAGIGQSQGGWVGSNPILQVKSDDEEKEQVVIFAHGTDGYGELGYSRHSVVDAENGEVLAEVEDMETQDDFLGSSPWRTGIVSIEKDVFYALPIPNQHAILRRRTEGSPGEGEDVPPGEGEGGGGEDPPGGGF